VAFLSRQKGERAYVPTIGRRGRITVVLKRNHSKNERGIKKGRGGTWSREGTGGIASVKRAVKEGRWELRRNSRQARRLPKPTGENRSRTPSRRLISNKEKKRIGNIS